MAPESGIEPVPAKPHPIAALVRRIANLQSRAGRTQCPGYLVVARQEVPAQIVWGYSSCGDDGVISGWEGRPMT